MIGRGSAALAVVLTGSPCQANSGAAPTRYLSAIDPDHLGYNPPAPAVDGSKEQQADLAGVRAIQPKDPASRDEAFADAEAFSFDALLPRFSVSAGRTLTAKRRPILAHMLKWALADAGAYGKIKDKFARSRPFVADPSIVPCDTSFMKTASPPPLHVTYSYPSGHATNGYLAGLVLSAVMTDRSTSLMARGERYGQNRVVCGVHYPSDVAEGQQMAKFLFALIVKQPAYQLDLKCALEEDAADINSALPDRRKPIHKSGYDDECAKLDENYYAEMSAL